MMRRHGSLILAITLIVLVAAACIVRTGPPRRGSPAYRPAPGGDHRKGKQKKQKKPKRHKFADRDWHDAPRDHR
jgi:hypothetical protein